ncbi:Abi-alpha family protein [Jongsikchunia kroppenstedtii]|uniref:Abi-alpha family protein n=1 Tax=Jongsikchunia kroppenstedtii TaxID=1121721 RepID=UPI0003634101|nr:Abi-alpha family protein [Jongsikchunia kroppenstedtii]
MANTFNPFGLVSRAVDVVRTGVDITSWTQNEINDLIRRGLNELDPNPRPTLQLEVAPSKPPEEPVVLVAKPAEDSLHNKLNGLLDRALDQDTQTSQTELYHHLLNQLVPDEARILGALSDGGSSPMVNVYGWTRSKAQSKAVLKNASLVGRTANVSLIQLTPQYVTHLLTLGLVESGPEDPSLKTDYEILLAEPIVIDAVNAASMGPIPARVDRFTVTISELGAALWAAAEGTGK